MFRWLKNWLVSRDLSRTTCSALEERRKVCADFLREAEERGDTRAIGFWTMALKQATHDVLRAA